MINQALPELMMSCMKNKIADKSIDHTPGDYSAENLIKFAQKLTEESKYINTFLGKIARGSFAQATEVIIAKDPERKSLKGHLKNTHLNALSIAILVNNLDAVKWICNHEDLKLSIINHPDHCGFTPLHWAYIVNNREVKTFLEENGANPLQQNNWEATPAEMASLTSSFRKESALPFSEKNTKTIKNESVKNILGPDICFSHDVFIPFDFLKQFWFAKETPNTTTNHEELHKHFWKDDSLDSKIKDFYTSPPKIHLEKDNESGLNVVASENIKENTIVCTYGGEFRPKSRQKAVNSEYLLGMFLDGDGPNHIRSYGSLVNDSYPNCIIVNKLVKGAYRPFLIAIENIEAGDSICFDYESHYIKAFDHSEMRYLALLKWLNEYQPQTGNPHTIKDLSPLLYLINTPSTFIALLLEGHYEKLMLCLKKIEPTFLLQEKIISPSIEKAYKCFFSFNKILSEHTKSESLLVLEYLIKAVKDRGSINTVVDFMTNTVEAEKLFITDITKLKEYELERENDIKFQSAIAEHVEFPTVFKSIEKFTSK